MGGRGGGSVGVLDDLGRCKLKICTFRDLKFDTEMSLVLYVNISKSGVTWRTSIENGRRRRGIL
jgi:hypothetical protein